MFVGANYMYVLESSKRYILEDNMTDTCNSAALFVVGGSKGK